MDRAYSVGVGRATSNCLKGPKWKKKPARRWEAESGPPITQRPDDEMIAPGASAVTTR